MSDLFLALAVSSEKGCPIEIAKRLFIGNPVTKIMSPVSRFFIRE
jgi:hypothetical protein